MQNKFTKVMLLVTLSISTSTFIVNTKPISITFPSNNSTIINNNKNFTIRGIISPTSLSVLIAITIDDGKIVGNATLNASNTNWSFTTKTPLSNGTHTIVATEFTIRFPITIIGRATSTFTLVSAPRPRPRPSSNSCDCDCR